MKEITKDKVKGKNTFKNLGDGAMIKQMAWNTFKNTGNIDTFLELMEVQNIEKTMNEKINGEENGNNKNEWNHITRE